MKMNSTKMMMMTILMFSTIVAMTSSSIAMTWMMMEINLMSFMPILTETKKMKDQSMKFLIIQSLSSSLMLMSVLINSLTETPCSLSIMLMTSMLMKMGMVPFHLWVPMIMKSMTWETCFIMNTWQKIIPTIIINQLTNTKMVMLPMIMSLLAAPMSAMNQLSTKSIMAYSSISNTPWMIASMMNSKSQFFTFMTIYSLMNMMIMKKFKQMNLNFINQMTTENTKKKVSIMVNILSISGMPPLMGFIPKWMILQTTISLSMMTSTAMILSSIMSTAIYMKMISPIIMTMNLTKKTKKEKNNKENDIFVNTMGTPITMMLKSN